MTAVEHLCQCLQSHFECSNHNLVHCWPWSTCTGNPASHGLPAVYRRHVKPKPVFFHVTSVCLSLMRRLLCQLFDVPRCDLCAIHHMAVHQSMMSTQAGWAATQAVTAKICPIVAHRAELQCTAKQFQNSPANTSYWLWTLSTVYKMEHVSGLSNPDIHMIDSSSLHFNWHAKYLHATRCIHEPSWTMPACKATHRSLVQTCLLAAPQDPQQVEAIRIVLPLRPTPPE